MFKMNRTTKSNEVATFLLEIENIQNTKTNFNDIDEISKFEDFLDMIKNQMSLIQQKTQ